MRYSIRSVFYALFFLSIMSCADKPHAVQVESGFLSPMERVIDGQVGAIPDQSWITSGWRGETLQRQLAYRGEEPPVLRISALKVNDSEIPSDAFDLLHPVNVLTDRDPRACDARPEGGQFVWLPDALSLEVEPRESKGPSVFWLRLRIPSDAAPGTYTGKIEVVVDEQVVKVHDLQVDVLPARLPSPENWQFHLDLWQFPAALARSGADSSADAEDLWSVANVEKLLPQYRILAGAGQKSITTYIKHGALGAPSMVEWILKEGGNLEFRFDAFERYVEAVLGTGIDRQISAFSVVGWNKNVIPVLDETSGELREIEAPLGSREFEAHWTAFLDAFESWLKAKGWFGKVVLYMDEVPMKEMKAVISLVKGHNPDWKLGLAYSHALAPEVDQAMYDASGIIEDAVDVANPDDRIRTFYTSCTQIKPNNYVTQENEPGEMTWMAWHALKQGYDGYLRWAYDFWTGPDTLDLSKIAYTGGDNNLIYWDSERSRAMTGMRFEMLRDGIEDFEKFRHLEAALAVCGRDDLLSELNDISAGFDLASGSSEDLIRNLNSARSRLTDLTVRAVQAQCLKQD